MHDFNRKDGQLYCEDVPLSALAEKYGTPLYVYSLATLDRHLKVYQEAFEGVDTIICFAMKANSNLAVLSELAKRGAGADIVSGGELYRAQKAGMDLKKMVYSGVGKTVHEMEEALNAGILMFNIESLEELQVLNEVAGRLGKKAPISLRVNPDVDPKTHKYVATGLKTSKFGISFENALETYALAGKLPNIDVVGIDCHIGSQLTELAPFIEAVQKLRDLSRELKQRGFNIKYFDLGGGLGIPYDAEEPPLPAEYGRAVREVLESEGMTLVLEPGRSIAGNAGVLLTRVLYNKESAAKKFIVVDAGMSELARPALYGSFHGIEPVVEGEGRSTAVVDVVGPICESGDFIAKEREMPAFEGGELMSAMSAGAYGMTMASNYNSRPFVAEVMVSGDKHAIVRERDTYEDLVRAERLPEFK